MANTIRIKRSTGSSAPTSLENAELAFAEGSKKLFVGIGTGGAGGSATTPSEHHHQAYGEHAGRAQSYHIV